MPRYQGNTEHRTVPKKETISFIHLQQFSFSDIWSIWENPVILLNWQKQNLGLNPLATFHSRCLSLVLLASDLYHKYVISLNSLWAESPERVYWRETWVGICELFCIFSGWWWWLVWLRVRIRLWSMTFCHFLSTPINQYNTRSSIFSWWYYCLRAGI